MVRKQLLVKHAFAQAGRDGVRKAAVAQLRGTRQLLQMRRSKRLSICLVVGVGKSRNAVAARLAMRPTAPVVLTCQPHMLQRTFSLMLTYSLITWKASMAA